MKLLSLILLLFLVGCGHTVEKEVVPIYIYTKVTCENYGEIDPIKTLPIIFVNAVDKQGYQVVGLRGDQYSNLAINSRKTIVYIIEQSKAIDYYENCIANHNAEQEEKEGQP